MFCNGELMSLYRTNFIMMHHFKYNIEVLENMIPYEREIYTLMLINQLDKEQKQLQGN